MGKRLLVVRGYLVGLGLSLGVLALLPNLWWAQWLTVFMVGFFLYGPQMLIGLCGAEIVGRDSVGARASRARRPASERTPAPRAPLRSRPLACARVLQVGASEGFLGWVAYLGAAAAGYPLSLLVKRCGWPVPEPRAPCPRIPARIPCTGPSGVPCTVHQSTTEVAGHCACGRPIFFQTLVVTSAAAFLLLSTIGNAKSFTQREQEA